MIRDNFVCIYFVQRFFLGYSSIYLRCKLLLICLKTVIHKKLYQFYQLSKIINSAIIITNLENIILMKQTKEAEYNHKMISIQCKFKFICQNYQKVLGQLQKKNKMIDQLHSKICHLEEQLERSQKHVNQLQIKVQKAQILSKSSSYKYINNNPLTSGKIEYQNISTKNKFQRQYTPAIESNVSIKDQLNSAYNKFNSMSTPKPQTTNYTLNEQGAFSKRLYQLKQKIGTQNQISINQYRNIKDIRNTLENSQKNLHIKNDFEGNISANIKKIVKNEGQYYESEQNLKALHKIWQQRDIEICKMDEIFESINDKLKQYEHNTN